MIYPYLSLVLFVFKDILLNIRPATSSSDSSDEGLRNTNYKMGAQHGVTHSV